MKIAEYNAGNAGRLLFRLDLRRLLKAKPLVLVLSEVNDRRGPLAWAAKRYGYLLFQYDDAARGHCAILARRDSKAHNFRDHKISDKTHVGRDVPGAGDTGDTAEKHIIAVDVTGPFGREVTIATAHFVPGASHSQAASEVLRIQANTSSVWLHNQPLPTDLALDCNGRAERPEFAKLREVATPVSAPSWRDSPIDIHWLTQGAGTAQALRGYSSDHRPVVADIHWRRVR